MNAIAKLLHTAASEKKIEARTRLSIWQLTNVHEWPVHDIFLQLPFTIVGNGILLQVVGFVAHGREQRIPWLVSLCARSRTSFKLFVRTINRPRINRWICLDGRILCVERTFLPFCYPLRLYKRKYTFKGLSGKFY